MTVSKLVLKFLFSNFHIIVSNVTKYTNNLLKRLYRKNRSARDSEVAATVCRMLFQQPPFGRLNKAFPFLFPPF